MKIINVLPRTLYVSLLFLTACSSETDISEVSGTSEDVTMIAQNFEYDAPSRTDIDITDGGVIFKWSKGDKIGIFPTKGAQADFNITSGAGTQKATFNGGGWALKPAEKYMAYYPLIEDFKLDKTAIPVSFKEQTQNINASTTHLSDYDFMTAVATTPNEGKVNFNFQHLCCLMELSFTLPDEGVWESATLLSADPFFATEGKVDLTSDIPIINVTSSSVKLDLNLPKHETIGKDRVVKVYFMMAPINMEGKFITLSLMKGDIRYEGVIEGKNYVAGKAYRLSTKLKAQTYWVDLGLSVKWATCNIGATRPEGDGYLFAFGNNYPTTKFYTENCVGYVKRLGETMSAISGIYDYDAATTLIGNGARMPLQEEMKELIEKTSHFKDTSQGRKGYRFISKTNGNSIFLPYNGHGLFSDIYRNEDNGGYWSGTITPSYTQNAFLLSMNNWYVKLDNVDMYSGYGIRPVCDK